MTIQTLAKDKSKKHLIGLQRGPDIVAIYREIEKQGQELSERMGRTLAELQAVPSRRMPPERSRMPQDAKKQRSRETVSEMSIVPLRGRRAS